MELSQEPPQQASPTSSEPSFGDQKWFEVFQDPQLQDLIRTALRAELRRAYCGYQNLGGTSAARHHAGRPVANHQCWRRFRQLAVCRQKPEHPLPDYETNATRRRVPSFAGSSTSGASTAAPPKRPRANLLATEWARRAVINTLVSEVAAAYFQLRAYDLQLEVSQQTLDSRQSSLRLTQTLERGGATNLLDVRQAEQLVAVAAENIPDFERHIQQQENFISTLLGNNPGSIARGMT